MAGEMLTPQQKQAVNEFLRGVSLTEVAKIVGVSRQTISKWFNQNEHVKAYADTLSRDYVQLRQGRYLAVLEDLSSTLLAVSEAVRERIQGGELPTPEMVNAMTRALIELSKREEAAGIPTSGSSAPDPQKAHSAAVDRLRKIQKNEPETEGVEPEVES